MKTTKDFPATHSMSTSWFVTDDEGNIALFDFDENGPVPVDIPEESNSYLMTAVEDFGEKDTDSLEYFELTDEQVEELMSDAVTPDKFNLDDDPTSLFVQVTETDKKEFLEVFIDEVDFCLSHKHGIYYIDWLYGYNKPDAYKKRAKETFLRTVKRVVHIWVDSYSNDDFDGNKENWKLPFYCYKQPYSSYTNLAKRTNIPRYPFKEEQITEEQRKKLIRVPLKFAECTGFQIAQYVICHWYGNWDDIELNKKSYTKFPKTEGGFGYFLRNQEKNTDGENPVILYGGE